MSDVGYVRGYDLTRNDIPLGEQDALSLFEEDLVPGVRYRYSITAVDDEGNRSPTVTLTLVCGEGVVDAEPVASVPEPANLRAEVYSTSAIELFWDRADTPGLVYQVSRDNTLIGETDGFSFFVDRLSDARGHDFTVKAIDSNGERMLAADIGIFERVRLDTGAGEAAFGNYGHVAVSGDTAVLPADRELIGGYARTGAVYVFTRDSADQWIEIPEYQDTNRPCEPDANTRLVRFNPDDGR